MGYMGYEELFYMIQKDVDVAMDTFGVKMLCVAAYSQYFLLDEHDIDSLKIAIEICARTNRSLALDSLGCIDSGLL